MLGLAGPVGRPIHYVWPKARDDFWPAGVSHGAEGSRGRGSLGGAEMCNVDVGLADALKLGREVLFAADNGANFVAISSTMDEQVRRRLFG